jgi:hypothetical protein
MSVVILIDECPACHAADALTVTRNDDQKLEYACSAGCTEDALLTAIGIAKSGHPPLVFLTPAQLRDLTPPEVKWLWDGYLAAGAVTLLVGKPKAGKSTLAIAASVAVAARGGSFLGRAVLGGAVVYVSEEGGGTLAHKLPLGDVDLHVLTRDGAWPKPEWKRLITESVAHATKVGAVLLVIDTAAFWTALAADKEKDAGAVQSVMMPLVEATRSGLAVLLIHHARKAGGEDGDAVRGSSGWAGSVDTIMELERPAGENVPANQRVIVALGRYPQTPAVVLIDFDMATGGWSALGEPPSRHEVRSESVRAAVMDALACGDGLTRAELEDSTARSWRDLSPVLKALVSSGLVERSGAGKKGSPHVFHNAVGEPATQNHTEPTASAAGGADFHGVSPVGGHHESAPPEQDAVAVDHTASTATAAEAAVIHAVKARSAPS